MKISLAIVISLITVIIGLVFGKSNIWLPFSFLLAGVIELPARKWIASDRLGTCASFSAALKILLTLIGFYALIGQVICIGIIIWWFIF